MGLQTSDLVMVALGVDGDARQLACQPPLVDGIHLRWAFPRARAFPWYGYYLFRRPHEFRGERCLAPELAAHAPGTDLGTTVSTALGVLSSREPIVASDAATPAGRPEVSLEGHSTVRLELPPGEPAFRLRVRVAFVQAASQLECIDFRQLRPNFHPNPLSVGKVVFAARDARGEPLPRIRLVTPADGARMDVALDGGALLEVRLPVVTRSARLDVTAEGRGSIIEALDDRERVVASVRPQLDPRQPTTVEVRAMSEFRRLRVRTPSGQILIHRLCWTAARALNIPVTVYDGPMVVGRASLAGPAGGADEALLTFDRITAIEVGGGPAVLVDLCVQIVPDVAWKDWQPVPDCPQPILFPLTHPDYPLAAAPEDIPATETRALQRIVYGPSGAWAGASFKSLYQCLAALIAGGPPGPPARAMAAPERAALNVAGVPTPATPGIDAPSLPSLHPLDLVLLGSLHPAVAQMVGMYWADKTANRGAAYDYLIVADHRNVGAGKASTLIEYISRNGFADVDAWIVFDRSMTPPAGPLAAPAGVRAYSLPGGTYREPGGVDASVQDADGNVGLTWPRPFDEQGYLRPEQPVLYHVWRDDQGNAANPQPSPQAETLVTERGPLLAARAPGIPLESAQYPGDWPPFSLAALDFALREGWYGYQINAIDIFGRFSPRSAFAEWHQWVPVPNPKPWYYIEPPADRVVHASSVRVLDRTPPPPPAFVEAWVLDPADPVVVRDAALDTWRSGLPAAQRNTLIGLRVRWRWTVAQQRQAPDTQEFRIYWNPGTAPPPEWERVASWLLRGYVTPYASNVTVAAGGDRSYDVFLPVTAGQGPFGAGAPLNPTRADPLLYANVTVTAADDSPQAQDTWPGAGPFAGRTGNESRAASPSRVYRVLRDPPPPPEPVVDSDRVYATPANWHARSYYTFRWVPQPNLFTHVFRAMDESVFAADWANPLANLDPNNMDHLKYFPDPVLEPAWIAAKRAQVADAINAAKAKAKMAKEKAAVAKTKAEEARDDGSDRVRTEAQKATVEADEAKAQALAAYRALNDDALRVLAALRGNEKAFVQLTLQALDNYESVFAADWAQRPRAALQPDDAARFPDPVTEPSWNAARRQLVCDAVNSLNAIPKTAVGQTQALGVYRALSDDALRVLTNLPGNEPATADRRGPDDPAHYVPRPGLRAYIDTLDGRATNRYLYRAVYVDAAENRSAMGPIGTPVRLPNVVPPRAPAITKVTGGERQITLAWASNREADLLEYRVFRTDRNDAAEDLRLMTRVAVVAADPDPAARPAAVTWTDKPVPGLKDYYYRIVAVDRSDPVDPRGGGGNVSTPSPAVKGRARQPAPAPPVLQAAAWNPARTEVRIDWQLTDPFLVARLERRRDEGQPWMIVGGALAPGTESAVDTPPDLLLTYDYRVRVRDHIGQQAVSEPLTTA